ncbi:MAG: glycine--tRNA ligase subunit beta [Candidatus Gastranaerophilales bacterium]|nr:glycine--tRNA ligase subunit beta [Candidatus Gastranaerophilales bacterium]
MSEYLLEIGVEELPYSLIEPISSQIKTNIEESLKEKNVKFSAFETYTTPRRLTFVIGGLEKVQQDTVKEIKGPPARIAFDKDDNLTQAGNGFLKKFNAACEQVVRVNDGTEEYLAIKIEEKGRQTVHILSEIIPESILKVQGHHFMRWENLEERFSRPIRWIVSILDEEVVPFELVNIKAGSISRGHRFAGGKSFLIPSVKNYFELLKEHSVIINSKEREALITQAADKIAQSMNASVKIEDELLKEVVNLVEYPVPVLGEFDKKYLDIPEPVIVTVMASHQRYFPVYDKDGKLLNCFITVANYLGDDFSNIKNGNERVIKARLDDAIFFFNEDIKKPLSEKVENLKGTTFQKGLGSVYDKVQRIIKLSDRISDNLNLSASQKEDALRTALLCKADLTTGLVFEFTELQGVIGAKYAAISGENPVVAKAVEEHYYPLAADGDLPSSIEAQVVSIADKIDTICSVFVLNKIPSGSQDPLGVRRASVGILQTVMQNNLKLDLVQLFGSALDLYNVAADKKEQMLSAIEDFIVQRLKGILHNTYAYDVVEAALGSKSALSDLKDFRERLDLAASIKQSPQVVKFLETQNRIAKLAQHTTAFTVDEALFIAEEEKAVYNYFRQNLSDGSHSEIMEALTDVIPVVEQFFEKVMVMDKDEKIKQNRLALLNNLNQKFLTIADFSKIV